MKDWFDNLRYDHPALFRWTVSIAVIFTLLFVFVSLPPSPLLRAIGVTTIQNKISSLYYAIFWQLRAATNTGDESVRLTVTYGYLVGLDKSGMLIVSIPTGSKFVQSKVQIADVKVKDLYGAAALIGQLRMEDVKFDVYSDKQVVVWIRNVPFNVKLIEGGFAIPDPNPPTNIVDVAFATYYWRKFNGAANE